MSAVAKQDLIHVVWEPLPGSQTIALDSRCNSTLYHGARGATKTLTQLMRYRRRVGIGYGAFWRGIIFDREFKNLSDLVAQSERFFTKFGDGAKFLSSAQEYKWVWPTGEELKFRHVKRISDYEGFHGWSIPFLGWNELTKFPTGDLYFKMMSINRSSFLPLIDSPDPKHPLPEIPLEVFSTTNPSGVGRNWVKRNLVDGSEPGEVVRKVYEVFNPRTQKDEKVTKTHVHIFGSWRENTFLSPEYIAELESITDPNLRRAWLYGDWNVTAGGAIDDLWDDNVHILPADFSIPRNWRIDRGFDWGSTEPFQVAWYAEANGEEVTMPDGSIFCPVAGSLIQVAEWYGSRDIGTNKGLKLSPTVIAEGIREREINFLRLGIFKTQPKAGPADNQIRNVNDVSVETIEAKMRAKGIGWTESDKSPGSNAMGLQVLRDRLEAALRREGKAFYVTRRCPATIELLPPIPRDEEKPDEVDRNYEKHVFDVIKYRLLAGNNSLVTSIDLSFV